MNVKNTLSEATEIQRRNKPGANYGTVLESAASSNRDPESKSYVFMTFACFHFSIVRDGQFTMPNQLKQCGDWGQAILNLSPSLPVTHTHITVCCPEKSCQDITSGELVCRVRKALQDVQLVLQIYGKRYLETGERYHELPLSIRAALADTPECALAHRQYGGMETLVWEFDPFSAPFLDALYQLDALEALVADNPMTTGLAGRVLTQLMRVIAEARQYMKNVTEVHEGVQLLLAYEDEHRYNKSIVNKERRVQVEVFTRAIRQRWEKRVAGR